MEERRINITLTICIIIMLMMLITLSRIIPKEEYKKLEEEKQYLLEQNIEYQNKIKILENEQDNKTNNLDTRF